MQVFYAGDYKSATEPFRLNKMSKYNREQIRDYMGDLYQTHAAMIAGSRDISVRKLHELANEEVFVEADKARQLSLVDAVLYKDQLSEMIKSTVGLHEDKDIKYIDIADYKKTLSTDYNVRDKIAVIYAEGEIRDSKDENGLITYDRYAKVFKKLRKDKKVKAVVMRVNSPGGSALASDNIWRETMLLKEAGKPFVVSFGNVAASGGYYISAAADKIYANENTITGSIGVFGMLADVHRFFDNKLKIHFDSVSTSENATSFTPFYRLTDKQHKIVQESVQEIYNTFIKRVADGRGLSLEKVKDIARGRVYSGVRAKEIGLVDELGGLDDAIEAAAELANLEKYRTVSYPKIKDPMQQMIDDLMGGKVQSAMADDKIQELLPVYDTYQMIKNCKGIQARLPFILLEDFN